MCTKRAVKGEECHKGVRARLELGLAKRKKGVQRADTGWYSLVTDAIAPDCASL